MLRVLYPGSILITFSLLGLLLVPACDSDEAASADPSEAASREAAGPPSTIVLDIELPADASPDLVSAIARSAEALAGPELSGATIEAKRTDEGAPMIVSVSVWGSALAEPEAIVAKLRAEHPSLADAAITVSTHPGAPADEPLIAGDHDLDESPADAKARIVQELRDKGVTGEISVDVVDEDEGRRVEVHVEEHDQP